MKKLLVAMAVIELGAGVALLAWPSQTVGALAGPSLPPPPAMVVRLIGVVLFALGVANALAARRGGGRAPRAVVGVMTLYNLLAAAGLAGVGVAKPPGGVILWPAVLLHAGMAVWCIWSLGARRRAA